MAVKRIRTSFGFSAVLLATIASLALAASASASTPSAWWGLTSGSRPTYLHGGQARENEQEILAPTGEFEGFPTQALVMSVAGKSLGLFASEPAAAILTAETGEKWTPLEASTVRSALEGAYGAGVGSVSVSSTGGKIVGEPLRLIVKTAGAVAPVTVEGLGLGEPTAKVLQEGRADGEIVVTAENLGDGVAQGSVASPVKIADRLPPGLSALGVSGWKAGPGASANIPVQLSCALESAATASCASVEAIPPYEQIEVRIAVAVQPGASSSEENQVTVSGGGAHAASLSHRLSLAAEPTPFGIEQYGLANEEANGAPATQAGSHPFQQTTTIVLNQGPDHAALNKKLEAQPAVGAKDTSFQWPAGLIGDPSAIAHCSLAAFLTRVVEENECPSQTVVGVAVVTVDEPALLGGATFTLPLFNLEPRRGEPARFGFNVLPGHAPVVIDTAVRTGSDYGVTVSSDDITQTAGLLSAKVTVWGVPGDPIHDRQRGWACLYTERQAEFPHAPCNALDESHPAPFLTLPTSCTGPLQSTAQADSWPASEFAEPIQAQPVTTAMPALDGCDRLPFSAGIETSPDGHAASTPTGLKVDVHVPQEVSDNPEGVANSNIKDIAVTLPEGVVLNPAAADGLQACAEGQIGYLPGESVPPSELRFTRALPEPLEQGVNFCPDAAKVGTVTIRTPLLPNPLEGAVYLATPAPNGEAGENPFNALVTMYIVAKDPISGTLVKLPGKVTLNPVTGQIHTTFENTPQLAFEDAELHFFGGERAPLATPALCRRAGEPGYQTVATFTPWSGGAAVTSTSEFSVTTGPGGGACPNPAANQSPGTLPFAPSLAAGTTNVNAGQFSPLTTAITREDGQQNIQTVKLHMPAGLSGILAGVKLCPEAQANAGTCGQESLIGHTIVSVGLGGDPYSVTGGQVYLTEKIAGSPAAAPFGLSIVNPAVAGPFNLGKVIVRARVEVDPHTAELTIATGEIPHILDGIPLQIKHVYVTIERPGFTFNPTDCGAKAITGSVTSVEGASSNVSAPFAVTNCAALKFAPKFVVSTSGSTNKVQGASLTATLSYPKAAQGTQTNIARVKVDLPIQLPSRLTTLQKACTTAQFEADPAGCPAASKIGYAKVTTPLLPVALQGPAIFVSHGGEAFPSLTMVLQGYGVTIDLVGTTFINHAGITSTTFKSIPDVPFNTFTLTLPEGRYSALAANLPKKAKDSFCAQTLVMPTAFVAQNGTEIHESTKLGVSGCRKPKKLAKKTNVRSKKK